MSILSPPIVSPRARGYAAWSLLAALLAILFYFLSFHVDIANADMDRGLLEGLDMAKGNVLLNHWYSGSDSYWTIDAVLFALGVLIIGAKAILVRLVSTFVGVAVIMVGIVIAGTGVRRGSKAASAATLIVILGLPTQLLACYLLPTDLHVATALLALIGFVGLRHGRFGWGWLLAVAVFTAGTLGDPLIVAYGLLPAFVVGVLDGVRHRSWTSSSAVWSAPIVAAVAAWFIRTIAIHLGTYRILGTTVIVPRALLLPNLRLLFEDTFTMFGVGRSLSTGSLPWELEIIRSLGLILAAAGFAVGAACLLLGVVSGRPRDEVQGMTERSATSFRLGDFLVLAVLGDAVTYVLLRANVAGMRYLTAGVIFASILAAMFVGELAQHVRTRRAVILAAIISVLVVGVSAFNVGDLLGRTTSRSPYAQLGAFLESHRLYRGVGDYWSSAPTTTMTDGVVTVRQVVPSPSGEIAPYEWISKSDWYKGTFQFLVYDDTQTSGQSLRQAAHFPFAPVARTYVEHQFHIIVWQRRESMAHLSALARDSTSHLSGA